MTPYRAGHPTAARSGPPALVRRFKRLRDLLRDGEHLVQREAAPDLLDQLEDAEAGAGGEGQTTGDYTGGTASRSG